jgi:hypothetical protein
MVHNGKKHLCQPSNPETIDMTHPLPLRQSPDPTPAVHPLPEYRVEGERAAVYADMKRTLQVPWMGVVTMAYAHYPTFFEVLWRGLKPIAGSRAFVLHCRELRTSVESAVRQLHPSPLPRTLDALGYAPREVDQIRDLIEVFSHGNFPYLLIASATRPLLEGGELGDHGDAAPFDGTHGPRPDGALVLMEPHHADPATRALYAEVKQTLGLPFVNTDYRALARWPSYFAAAWRDLAPRISDPAHAAICDTVHRDALERVAHALPNPAGLDGEELRAAAAADAPLAEVLGVARLFQWLLPGLVTNIAFLRAQLT